MPFGLSCPLKNVFFPPWSFSNAQPRDRKREQNLTFVLKEKQGFQTVMSLDSLFKHQKTTDGLIHLAQLNTCRPNTTNKYIKLRYVWVVQTGTGRRHRAMTWPEGTDLAALRTGPLEPILRDEDVDVDDIPVGHHTPNHVVHLQLQDGVERAHDGPHLAHDTWEESRRCLGS